MRKVQNIFYDSEFEQPENQFNIIPISYGFVPEDGSDKFYGVNAEMPEGLILKREWMRANVMAKLPPKFGNEWQSMNSIRTGILDFFQRNAYDNTVLCMTFGSMGSMMASFKELGIKRLEFRDMNELGRALKKPDAAPLMHDRAHICLFDADYDRYLFHRYRSVYGPAFETIAAPKLY